MVKIRKRLDSIHDERQQKKLVEVKQPKIAGISYLEYFKLDYSK